MRYDNTPDDWDNYYRTCSNCGRTWHASEGGCECEFDDEEETNEEPDFDIF